MDSVAVYSDVHADKPALEAILAEIKAAGISRIWCLGDFCSGGPDPAECFDLTIEHCELVLAGNHELFVTLKVFMDYSGGWADAAYYAYQHLGADRISRLQTLKSQISLPEAELVHGDLDDPASGFILNAADAMTNLSLISQPLLLFGHTHHQAFYQARTLPFGALAFQGSAEIELDRKYSLANAKCALNPGSACDDRGGMWLELDLEPTQPSATWHQTKTAGHGGIASIF